MYDQPCQIFACCLVVVGMAHPEALSRVYVPQARSGDYTARCKDDHGNQNDDGTLYNLVGDNAHLLSALETDEKEPENNTLAGRRPSSLKPLHCTEFQHLWPDFEIHLDSAWGFLEVED
jgi:hypothetical protein